LVDLGTRVPELLRRHPAVRRSELAGSRAAGCPTNLSDWDFVVETDDLGALAAALPELVAPLDPLAQQWDPLGEPPCYMLMLHGPQKLDLIFPGERVELRQPWEVRPDTLSAIDAHFWDWLLWLGAKRARGREELVREELAKMHGFLLAPLGVRAAPGTLEEAVGLYLPASREAQRRLGVDVPGRLRDEVLPAVCGRAELAAGTERLTRS
jgi:hypothetical protein